MFESEVIEMTSAAACVSTSRLCGQGWEEYLKAHGMEGTAQSISSKTAWVFGASSGGTRHDLQHVKFIGGALLTGMGPRRRRAWLWNKGFAPLPSMSSVGNQGHLSTQKQAAARRDAIDQAFSASLTPQAGWQDLSHVQRVSEALTSKWRLE